MSWLDDEYSKLNKKKSKSSWLNDEYNRIREESVKAWTSGKPSTSAQQSSTVNQQENTMPSIRRVPTQQLLDEAFNPKPVQKKNIPSTLTTRELITHESLKTALFVFLE